MTARDELAELIARTNTAMGRQAGAYSNVTPEEMLRLWRNNVAFRQIIGPAADTLLARYDAEERAERAKRETSFGSYGDAFGINPDLLREMYEEVERRMRQRAEYEQRWSHTADAFRYSTFGFERRGNPFAGQSHAQQFRQPPQDPERTAAIAQARKIKALADDTRGNQHQRNVAKRKLDEIKAKHGLTEQELR